MTAMLMSVCTTCGGRTVRKTCPLCNQTTVPEHLIPSFCLDCGIPLNLPPHLRTLLGQCEDCADANRMVIGLRAWKAILCDLI